MKKFSVVLALVLLAGFSTAAAQDSGSFAKLVDAFAPYLHMIQEAFKPLPACADLDNANLRVNNTDGAITMGAVFCREIAEDGEYQLNPGVIGDPRVIERGVQQAYDVFALNEAGEAVQRFDAAITVCLKGRGDLLFMPSFAAPRPVQTPQTYTSDDFTCARLGSSGIVALVNG
jgi:hypothetical protein